MRGRIGAQDIERFEDYMSQLLPFFKNEDERIRAFVEEATGI